MDDNNNQTVGKDVEVTPATSEPKINVDTNTAVAVKEHGSDLQHLNFLDPKQIEAATFFLEKVMRSNKTGFTTVNDGLAILMRAQSLDIPFATAVEHIHVINGKTGVDIHVIKALLLRAGVTWRILKDYAPLYEYTDGINVYIDNKLPDYVEKCKSQAEAEEKTKKGENKDIIYIYPVIWYSDFKGNMYRSYNLDNRFAIAINKAHAVEISKTGKIPIYRIPNQPVDYVTEYEFRRVVDKTLQTTISSFSYTEANAAGLFTKDTYKNYPKVLIGHRAFTYGARDIASDIIMGCMETTELKIATDTPLNQKDFIEAEVVPLD